MIMGLFQNIILFILVIAVIWYAGDQHWIELPAWVPDFPIDINITNVWNQQQYTNQTVQPSTEPTGPDTYNLALELQAFPVFFIDFVGNCTASGGTPVVTSEEVACRHLAFNPAICSTAAAVVAENQCESVYHATWTCDAVTGYIGCKY